VAAAVAVAAAARGAPGVGLGAKCLEEAKAWLLSNGGLCNRSPAYRDSPPRRGGSRDRFVRYCNVEVGSAYLVIPRLFLQWPWRRPRWIRTLLRPSLSLSN
jgi:hypothetical protein